MLLLLVACLLRKRAAGPHPSSGDLRRRANRCRCRPSRSHPHRTSRSGRPRVGAEEGVRPGGVADRHRPGAPVASLEAGNRVAHLRRIIWCPCAIGWKTKIGPVNCLMPRAGSKAILIESESDYVFAEPNTVVPHARNRVVNRDRISRAFRLDQNANRARQRQPAQTRDTPPDRFINAHQGNILIQSRQSRRPVRSRAWCW